MKYVFRKRRYAVLAGAADRLGPLFIRRQGPVPTPPSPKNILIVRLDHLGDVLPATGIPKALKESFPAARVTFLTSSWAAPLLADNPFVDELLLWDAPWFARGLREDRRGVVSLTRQLKQKRFDLGLSLRGDARENALLWAAGVKERVGFGITGGGFFLTKELTYRRGIHETAHTADLLGSIGVRSHHLEPELYFTESEDRRLDEDLAGMGFRPGRWMTFQVSAGTPSKNWPVHQVSAFLRLFQEEFPAIGVCLIGAPSEPYGVAGALDLRGKTSLRQLLRIIRQSEIFVGPDSGPTHLAAALGLRTLFLFSGTNEWARWRPLSERAAALRHAVGCSPCLLERCNVDGHPCVSEITPTQVLAEVRAWLR